MIEIERHCPIKPATHTTSKFSFNEKREPERLEKEIEELETEIKTNRWMELGERDEY